LIAIRAASHSDRNVWAWPVLRFVKSTGLSLE
jgi:hypothetical protein